MRTDRRHFVTGLALGGLGSWGAPRLRAGAAIADITPPLGASLKGPVGGNGILKTIHDPLYARCLALEAGVTRLAICVCDATMIWERALDRAKQRVTARTGLAPERILISSTHSHAAPRVCGLSDAAVDVAYYASLEERIANAICQALANLAPAQIGWGVIEKPKYIHRRRSRIEPGSNGPNPFGEHTDRAWMYAKAGTALQPEGRADPYFSVLSVRHTDGRPLAMLGNYSVHYTGGFKRDSVTADYFGCFAEEMGARLGAQADARPPFVGIMSNGNSGNIAPAQGVGGYEGMRTLGRELADDALRIGEQATHHTHIALAMCEEPLALGVRRPTPQRVQWAHDVLDGKIKGPAHPWREIYARGALALAEYPATVTPRFQALRLGDLGITASPVEMYAETGLEIREQSPLKPTFNIELANGYYGYLPTPEQHTLGGYTTWPNISSFLETEASNKIRAHLLKLLRRVESEG